MAKRAAALKLAAEQRKVARVAAEKLAAEQKKARVAAAKLAAEQKRAAAKLAAEQKRAEKAAQKEASARAAREAAGQVAALRAGVRTIILSSTDPGALTFKSIRLVRQQHTKERHGFLALKQCLSSGAGGFARQGCWRALGP